MGPYLVAKTRSVASTTSSASRFPRTSSTDSINPCFRWRRTLPHLHQHACSEPVRDSGISQVPHPSAKVVSTIVSCGASRPSPLAAQPVQAPGEDNVEPAAPGVPNELRQFTLVASNPGRLVLRIDSNQLVRPVSYPFLKLGQLVVRRLLFRRHPEIDGHPSYCPYPPCTDSRSRSCRRCPW